MSDSNCQKDQTKEEGAFVDLTLEVKDKEGKTPGACSRKVVLTMIPALIVTVLEVQRCC